MTNEELVEKAARLLGAGEPLPSEYELARAVVNTVLEEAANVADLYAEENIRMAGDTILHDPSLKGDFSAHAIEKHEALVIKGCSHSAMFHASQNIAAALRALKSEPPK